MLPFLKSSSFSPTRRSQPGGKISGTRLPLLSSFILARLALTVLAGFPAQAKPWNPQNIERIEANGHNPLYFAVMGDSREGDAVFQKILKDLNQIPELAFAVHLGDLVPGGGADAYAHFFRLIAPFKRPLLTVAGNHELRGMDAAGLYRQIFGPANYAFRVGPHHFLVLNNNSPKDVDTKTLRWLEEELEKGKEAQTRIIFMHKPLFNLHRGSQHALDETTVQALLDLFKRHRVTHIFAAHIHAYFTGNWEGIPFTISGGAGAPLYPWEPSHSFYHYLTVKLSGENVGVEMHRIAAPPKLAEPAGGPGG